jgi:hypothetical protein
VRTQKTTLSCGLIAESTVTIVDAQVPVTALAGTAADGTHCVADGTGHTRIGRSARKPPPVIDTDSAPCDVPVFVTRNDPVGAREARAFVYVWLRLSKSIWVMATDGDVV